MAGISVSPRPSKCPEEVAIVLSCSGYLADERQSCMRYRSITAVSRLSGTRRSIRSKTAQTRQRCKALIFVKTLGRTAAWSLFRQANAQGSEVDTALQVRVVASYD